MRISDVLKHKPEHAGSDVVTIAPTATVRELLAVLTQHGIGAVVVVDNPTVRGIVSERDVVRALHTRGSDLLDAAVGEIMTTSVFSCRSDDDLDSVASTMTTRRIRHMPVIDDDTLTGLVSIGDVVSSRIHQLEQDRGQLEQYITG